MFLLYIINAYISMHICFLHPLLVNVQANNAVDALARTRTSPWAIAWIWTDERKIGTHIENITVCLEMMKNGSHFEIVAITCVVKLDFIHNSFVFTPNCWPSLGLCFNVCAFILFIYLSFCLLAEHFYRNSWTRVIGCTSITGELVQACNLNQLYQLYQPQTWL